MENTLKNNTMISSITSEKDMNNSFDFSLSSPYSQKIIKMPSPTGNLTLSVSISFKKQEQWSDSFDCCTCSQTFNRLKGVFKHHCRVCGSSCCGDCSGKKVNDERVCDICYLRIENFELIEKKKDILSLKDQLMEEMFNEYNGLSIKKLDICSDIENLSLLIKADQKKNIEKMTALRKELNDKGENYKEKLEDYKRIRDVMLEEKDVLLLKEEELNNWNKKVSTLKEEVQAKENSYKSKTNELADYMGIFGKVKTCESFLHLKIPNEDLLNLDGIRSNSKDYSSFLMKKSVLKSKLSYNNYKFAPGLSQMNYDPKLLSPKEFSLKEHNFNYTDREKLSFMRSMEYVTQDTKNEGCLFDKNCNIF